ncbi:MAG: hypothetical protein NVSMB31_20470 [Vulcanimicrobiaceae bacterium]
MKRRLAIATGVAVSLWILCLQPAWSAAPDPAPSPTASPTPSQEQVSRGAELFNHGRFAEAIKFFDLAVKLDGTNAFALAFRGRTYFLMDRFDRSLADLDRGLRLEPNDALLHVLRGLTLWSMGVNASAAEDFAASGQGAQAPSEYWSAIAALAYLDDCNKNAARTMLLACKKHCTDKKSFDYDMNRYLLGEVAAPALLAAAKTDWDKADAHALIAITFLQRGDARSAKPHLMWIVHNAKPYNNWLPYVRQRLKRMR